LPFNEFDIIQSPVQYALGVEYPGLVLINAAMYSPINQYHDRLETTIAHEVAHQWWYSMVGNDVVAYPWMDEALTSYSSLVYLREVNPPYYDRTMEYYENRMSNLPALTSLRI